MTRQISRVESCASTEGSGRGKANMVQPLTKVRVRHHQVDQPAILGTRYTRNAQGAGLCGADGALGLRLCSDLDHVDSLKQHWFLGALALDTAR